MFSLPQRLLRKKRGAKSRSEVRPKPSFSLYTSHLSPRSSLLHSLQSLICLRSIPALLITSLSPVPYLSPLDPRASLYILICLRSSAREAYAEQRLRVGHQYKHEAATYFCFEEYGKQKYCLLKKWWIIRSRFVYESVYQVVYFLTDLAYFYIFYSTIESFILLYSISVSSKW